MSPDGDDAVDYWPVDRPDTQFDEPGDIPGVGAVRRALRIRSRAAQLLAHTITTDTGGVDQSFADLGHVDFPDFFQELLSLIATYAPTEVVEGLRSEILNAAMVLGDE